jgi:crotonobetainyl-CoA:carnitine CoA-transferase CaiB-like acyl-CoA transferase
MAITGDAESAPLRVGYPVADTVGGMTAALADLRRAERAVRARRLPRRLDAGGGAATMGWVVSNHLIAGVRPAPQGNENPTSAPSGTFRAADGRSTSPPTRTSSGRSSPAIWAGTTCWGGDYATREARKANRHALRAELETVLTTRPARDWARELNASACRRAPCWGARDRGA